MQINNNKNIENNFIEINNNAELSCDERINNGLKINSIYIHNGSPPSLKILDLQQAIFNGEKEKVRTLLKELSVHDINSTYKQTNLFAERNLTPLSHAAALGKHEILLDLVEAGASNCVMKSSLKLISRPALYNAAFFIQTKSVCLLLKLGADPARGIGSDPKCFAFIVKALPESIINKVNENDLTVLDIAKVYNTFCPRSIGFEIIKHLEDLNADSNEDLIRKNISIIARNVITSGIKNVNLYINLFKKILPEHVNASITKPWIALWEINHSNHE